MSDDTKEFITFMVCVTVIVVTALIVMVVIR